VRTFLFEDVYLSVLNIETAGGKVGLLALVNPMVGWIWGATGLMALGGLLALWPRREGALS
jgi:cytochrome c biogenesis factor